MCMIRPCKRVESSGGMLVSDRSLNIGVTVHVFAMLGKYFVSVKYVFVCIKLMCVYGKLLKI
jgi:hypothetical protein